MQDIHDPAAHWPLRHMRHNYGSRTVMPGTQKTIDCGLVLLDLLMPDHWWTSRRGPDPVVRNILVSSPEQMELVYVRNASDTIFRMPVEKSIINGLLHFDAISQTCFLTGVITYGLTGVGWGILRGFLKLHDEMHVGESLELRPGIYRHMKGNPYNILWASEDTETKEITVEYQPLAGPAPLRHSHRPLSMFTQVVYRPELGHYLGPRWRLEKEFPEPRRLKSAEEVEPILAKE